ncbi:Uncharacterised protein [Vibrio cholerae]|nr:Uncharacterised protein [Vibrio cholerae]CSI64310.1 Uncharacterised protein [Vibrio cholerae]
MFTLARRIIFDFGQSNKGFSNTQLLGTRHGNGNKIHRANKLSHKTAGGLLVDLLRRTNLLNHPVVHHHNAIRHG